MTTMSLEKCCADIGETAAMKDHDRDLVHELSKRLDCLWRCDQYNADADGDEERSTSGARSKSRNRIISIGCGL